MNITKLKKIVCFSNNNCLIKQLFVVCANNHSTNASDEQHRGCEISPGGCHVTTALLLTQTSDSIKRKDLHRAVMNSEIQNSDC